MPSGTCRMGHAYGGMPRGPPGGPPAGPPGAPRAGLAERKSYRIWHFHANTALRGAPDYAKRPAYWNQFQRRRRPGVTDTILETEGLTREFGGFVAVDGVDLRVGTGQIHALIGPNGAGKTTCFNLLTSFLPPTRGKITFKGRDITGMKPAAVARLGLIRSFQISAVFPHLTALENVRLALQRARGASFDFWRSESVLKVYDDRAH